MTERPAERTPTRPSSKAGASSPVEDTAVRPTNSGRTTRQSRTAKQAKTPPTGRQPREAREGRQAKPTSRPASNGKSSPAVEQTNPNIRRTPAAPEPSVVPQGRRPGRPGRKARLRLTRVDPWSVMKTAFLLSIAFGVVTIVSVLMVWTVLGAADVWGSINNTVQDIVGGQDASNFDIEDYLGTQRVIGFTMIVAAVDVVLLTAIATLGAFLYNMAASLLGGIEVTLAEDN